MLKELDDLNQHLQAHLDVQLRIGIGIHFGDVIVGEFGHPKKMQFTAIGDAVNVASRIESATKKAGVPLLVSQDLYQQIRDFALVGLRRMTRLKGKSGRYRLYEVIGLSVAPGTVVGPEVPSGRSAST